MTSDFADTLLILIAISVVTAGAAAVLRRPRPRFPAEHGSPHRREIDRPHRQAIQHFASGALPPWR